MENFAETQNITLKDLYLTVDDTTEYKIRVCILNDDKSKMRFVTDDSSNLFALANNGKIQNIWYYDGLYDDENQIYAYTTLPDEQTKQTFTLSPLVINPQEQTVVGHYSQDGNSDKYVGFMFADNLRNIQKIHSPLINLAHINDALEKLCDCNENYNFASDKYKSRILSLEDIRLIEKTLNSIKTHNFETPNDHIIFDDIFENTPNTKTLSQDM